LVISGLKEVRVKYGSLYALKNYNCNPYHKDIKNNKNIQINKQNKEKYSLSEGRPLDPDDS